MISTANKTIKYLRTLWSSGNCYIDLDTFQIEEGATATTYESYQGQTYPINLPVQNLFNKNGTIVKTNGTTGQVLDTGMRATATLSGNNLYYVMKLGSYELLGKTLTIKANIQPSASNTGQIYLFYGNSSSSTVSAVSNGNLTGSGEVTKQIIIPKTFPANTDQIYILLYANINTSVNIGDYVDYTNLQVELGDKANSYVPYGENVIELCKIYSNQDYLYYQNNK